MRHWLTGPAFLVALLIGAAMAEADDGPADSAMLEAAATGELCDAARGQLQATGLPCKITATSTLDGRQRATLLEIHGDPGVTAPHRSSDSEPREHKLTRYVVAIEAADGRRWLSPPIDHLEGTRTPARAAMKIINASGRVAAIADVRGSLARTAAGVSPGRSFVACRDTGSGAWACARQDLTPSELATCAVSLSATGTLDERCERRVALRFGKDFAQLGETITSEAMVELELKPGRAVCDAVPDKPPGAACDVVAGGSFGKRKATLVKLELDGDTAYRAIIDAEGRRWLSEPVVFHGMQCAMLHCNGDDDITASVGPVTTGGQPAVAIELHAIHVREHSDPDGGKGDHITTPVTTFLVCGSPAGVWTCLRVEGEGTGSLSATGTLTSRWTSRIDLIMP